jgi:actin-related protein 6
MPLEVSLPDLIRLGFVKEDDAMEEIGEQILSMETERFTVPEVLFHPSDIGMNQAGITEATWQSLSELSEIEIGQ